MNAYRLLTRTVLGLTAALLLVLPVAADTEADAPLREDGIYCFSREELDTFEKMLKALSREVR